jgi:hypothetical protein
MLTCTRCKEEKPATAEFFPLHNKKINGLDSWCRLCRNAYKKATKVPAGVIDITKALEAKTLTECVICGLTRPVVIDHDHSTGDVRGGLCQNCNLGLGQFKDDPELLRMAALYLEGKCACGKCEVYWGGKSLRAWDC